MKLIRKIRPDADGLDEGQGARSPIRLSLIEPLPMPDATPVDFSLFADATYELQHGEAFADTVIEAHEDQMASQRAATLESLQRQRLESPVERQAREEAARRAEDYVKQADATLAAAAPALAAARAAIDAAAGRMADETEHHAEQARLAQARRERLQAESAARERAEQQARLDAERLAQAEQALNAAAAEAERARAEEARLREAAAELRRRAEQASEAARSLGQRQAQAHGPAAPVAAAAPAAEAAPAPAPAPASAAARLGEVLVAGQRLKPVDVEVVLMHQASQNRRFGEIAVNLGLVAVADIEWALRRQPPRPAPAGLLPAGLPASDELVLAHAPSGDAAHVIRDIAGHLMRGPAAARGVFAVVGVDVGEGKTYLAANLAVALAQAGRRTLLIEGDLRRPRLASIFPVATASRGLAGVLCGHQRLADAIVMPAGLTNTPTLHLLPAGSSEAEPLELLQLQAFEVLLERVAGHFDQVVIDTPATRHWGADTRLLAALAGQSLVVGRPGRTRMDELDRLLGSLRRGGSAIAGVVMNAH